MLKKKILFLVQLPPPVHGASLRNEFLAKSNLLHASFSIEVMRLDFAKSIEDVGEFSIMKLIKMAGFTFRLFFKLLGGKYDLVYYNFAVRGIALYRDWLFIHIVKLFSIPLALHIRTQGVDQQIANSRFKRFIFKSAFSNTTIVCLSKLLARDIETVYNKTPRIIADGIDLVVPSTDIEKRKENKYPKFLFLSNLTKSKGVIEFIDALKIIRDNGHDFTGEIIGPEFDIKIDYLNKYLSDLNLSDNVRVTGPVYGDEKFQKFLGSDIFVFPTWFEAFPGVILEAMQCGLAVVTTKEGAIPEIVNEGETGFLVQQKDVTALAEKMTLLVMDQGLKQKMGLAGRAKFEKIYTSANYEQQANKVFKEILGIENE